MSCLFGIVVSYTEKNCLEHLEKTINSLKNIVYDNKKIKIVISSCNITKEVQNIVHLTNVIKETFPASECIFHLDSDTKTKDTECFMKIIEATFFVKIKAGGTIQPDLFNKINADFNKPQDLDSYTAIKTERGSKLVFNKFRKLMLENDHTTIIYKELMQDHYLDFNDYDLATNYIRSLCVEQKQYEEI